MSLLSKKEYCQRFWYYRKLGFTHQKAWEKTQDDLELVHGQPEHKGFSSLESFKNALSRWIKEKSI